MFLERKTETFYLQPELDSLKHEVSASPGRDLCPFSEAGVPGAKSTL